MKMAKRILSLILALVLVVGYLPVQYAWATEEKLQTSVDENLTIEGTNGFGALLSQELETYQTEEEEETECGYAVVGLTVEGSTATVEYSSLEEATLVVALYSEDGQKLLNSAKTDVSAEETTATVIFEGDMPEYFMASAYLLDVYDFSPLSASYDTPMYTQQMQELLASTVEDYDADRVLNLDESTDTNFAVYAHNTIVLEQAEGTNTVASVDDENATYVIENADESITGLREGDVLAYPYGENEILIAKVATVTVDGTTATITGADVQMEEVFSHIKIETEGDSGDVVVDDTTADEGVTFEGITQEGTQTYALRAVEGETGGKFQLNFSLNKSLKSDSENADSSVTVKGSFGLQLDMKLSFYVADSRQFYKFKTDVGLNAQLSASGKATGKISLGSFDLSPYGISIEFAPELQLQFSGKVEYSAFMGYTFGVSYESGKGIQDLSTTPKVETKLKVEGTIFLGIDLMPKVKVLGGVLASLKLEAPIGIELKATQTGNAINPSSDNAPSKHSCKDCLKLTLDFKVEVSATLTLLKCIPLEAKWDVIKIKLNEFYWSVDQDEFGTGTCPYISYRITVLVLLRGNPTPNINVYANEKFLGTANSYGVVVGYLPAGDYTLRMSPYGVDTFANITVEGACKITFGDDAEVEPDYALDGVDPDEVTERLHIIASGKYSATGSNVTWELDSSGVLYIGGVGEMADCPYWGAPWVQYHIDDIRKVVIGPGVTNITQSTFFQHENLVSVIIGDGVTVIEPGAFSSCDNLESVVIGSSVREIGSSAFFSCEKLTGITIPGSTTKIGGTAFDGCESLAYVDFGDSVEEIGAGAFSFCKNLTEITLPKDIKNIGGSAFLNCQNLTEVIIGDEIANIGSFAFAYCSNLKNIVFKWSAPAFEEKVFDGVEATTYYPLGNPDWTVEKLNDYGGTITWESYDTTQGLPIAASEITMEEEPTLPESASGEAPSTGAIWGGEYSSDLEYTLKKAEFSGLVAGEEYVLLSLVSLDAEDPLSAENLLYIDQATAGENGSLEFQYIQREDTEVSYVMACGASNKNLGNATVTFPEMYADEEVQAVTPTVEYLGATLTEGVDYTVVGTVDYTEAGTYTCYIRGIRDYTGLVECQYTVESLEPEVFDFMGANMALDNSLAMNFAFATSHYSDWTGFYAEIIKMYADGRGITTVTIPVENWANRGSYYIVTYGGVTAKEMADNFYITIYNADGEAVSVTRTDSVRAYARRTLNSAKTTDALKTVIVDMLNYGAAAQTYFGYGTNNLANSDLSDVEKALASADVAVSDDRVKGTNFGGSNLTLDSNIQMTLVFRNMTEGMYAKATYTNARGVQQSVDGQVTLNGNIGFVYINSLAVADYDCLVTVTVYNADGSVHGTASDSVASYVYRNNIATNVTETLKVLGQELVKLAESARAYFVG